MPSSFRLRSKEDFGFVRALVKWVLLGAWVGTLSGGATALREAHLYLLFGVPVTGLTLGTGFKGSEVTPHFYIGATLGAAFARLTGQHIPFFAALGFVAVFMGAANTPIACTLMEIGLSGSPIYIPLAAASFLAYIVSGH